MRPIDFLLITVTVVLAIMTNCLIYSTIKYDNLYKTTVNCVSALENSTDGLVEYRDALKECKDTLETCVENSEATDDDVLQSTE
jgi:hypothetical protein